MVPTFVHSRSGPPGSWCADSGVRRRAIEEASVGVALCHCENGPTECVRPDRIALSDATESGVTAGWSRCTFSLEGGGIGQEPTHGTLGRSV